MIVRLLDMSNYSLYYTVSFGTFSCIFKDLPKSALYNKFGLTIRDLRFQHPSMMFVRNRKLIMRFQVCDFLEACCVA